MKTIVVVGGGFAGVYTVKHLLHIIEHRHFDAHVVLLSDHNYFLFTPLLHEVATGGISQTNVTQPLRNIFSSSHFTYYKIQATHVDTHKCLVFADKFKQRYDTLVLATGSEINFFNVKGAKEHSIPLRTFSDALHIRDAVIARVEAAEETATLEERKRLLTFSIIGGGPTGVELAGELAEYLHSMIKSHYKKIQCEDVSIFLYHRGTDLLNMLPEYYRKKCAQRLKNMGVTLCLSSEIINVGKEYVIEADHKKKFAGLIFWTAGFKARTLPLNDTSVLSYLINPQFHVHGYKHLFALGDCASLEIDEKKVPMLAQVAIQQAAIVAHNTLADLGCMPSEKTYRFRLRGYLLSVGQKFGVAGIKDFYFSGFFAWWIWRTIYLSKLLGFSKKVKVAVDWTLNFFYPRDTTEIDEKG